MRKYITEESIFITTVGLVALCVTPATLAYWAMHHFYGRCPVSVLLLVALIIPTALLIQLGINKWRGYVERRVCQSCSVSCTHRRLVDMSERFSGCLYLPLVLALLSVHGIPPEEWATGVAWLVTIVTGLFWLIGHIMACRVIAQHTDDVAYALNVLWEEKRHQDGTYSKAVALVTAHPEVLGRASLRAETVDGFRLYKPFKV